MRLVKGLSCLVVLSIFVHSASARQIMIPGDKVDAQVNVRGTPTTSTNNNIECKFKKDTKGPLDIFIEPTDFEFVEGQVWCKFPPEQIKECSEALDKRYKNKPDQRPKELYVADWVLQAYLPEGARPDTFQGPHKRLENVFKPNLNFCSFDTLSKGFTYQPLQELLMHNTLRFEHPLKLDPNCISQEELQANPRLKDLRADLKICNCRGLSSTFDPGRWHPIKRKRQKHRGIDVAAPSGMPIYAPADGVMIKKIRENGGRSGYGFGFQIEHFDLTDLPKDVTEIDDLKLGELRETPRTVVIKRCGVEKIIEVDRVITQYGHISNYPENLKENRYSRTGHNYYVVRKGDIIGYIGNTGDSTGPHLDLEFHVDPKGDTLKNTADGECMSRSGFGESGTLSCDPSLFYDFGQEWPKYSLNYYCEVPE